QNKKERGFAPFFWGWGGEGANGLGKGVGGISAKTTGYPALSHGVPWAGWGERGVRDMYGFIPVGLPDERRLVLPDDWPDELYPLRKDSMDYGQRPAPPTDAETYEFIIELGAKKKNPGPIGPWHVLPPTRDPPPFRGGGKNF
ncbi:NADH-quinone oxidoreductase subunit C, partial [Escherichia coli]|nr:NADH-quinone oxidoreductase subunit C [Escherichia coli]